VVILGAFGNFGSTEWEFLNSGGVFIDRMENVCFKPWFRATQKFFKIILGTLCHDHLHIAFYFFLAFSCLLYFSVFICVYVFCYHKLVNKDLIL